MENGTVSLVGITKPTLGSFDINSAEKLLAYIARVSNPANQDNHATARKLIEYLIKNRHWSPFEMIHLVMEIVTTRDIGRQILRHRSFSFQEFSQRYKEIGDFAEPREVRLQDPKNRQNSLPFDGDLTTLTQWEARQRDVLYLAKQHYEWALTHHIAKEQARAILPEGLTLTKLYMGGTLRSWIHYIDVRAADGMQHEHRKIAEKCKMLVLEEFPVLRDYWEELI